jgi:hypothetical protein
MPVEAREPQPASTMAAEGDVDVPAPSTGVSTRAPSSSRQRSVSVVSESEQEDQLSLQADDKDETAVENMVAPAEDAMSVDPPPNLHLAYPSSCSSPAPAGAKDEMLDDLLLSRAGSTSATAASSEGPEHRVPGAYPGLAGGTFQGAMAGYEDDSHTSEFIDVLATTLVAQDQDHAYQAAPASRFYGQTGKEKGKEKETYLEIDELEDDPVVSNAAAWAPAPAPDEAAGADSDANADELFADQPSGDLQPLIFSFDSLGSRHRALYDKLSSYLLLEAKDKLQRDQDTLTKAAYKKAEVRALLLHLPFLSNAFGRSTRSRRNQTRATVASTCSILPRRSCVTRRSP